MESINNHENNHEYNNTLFQDEVSNELLKIKQKVLQKSILTAHFEKLETSDLIQYITVRYKTEWKWSQKSINQIKEDLWNESFNLLIQCSLKKLGYFRYTIDWYTSSKQSESIKDFQKNNNLKIDGIVWLKTLKKIYSELKKLPLTK
jgi:murein L,D-transpeptidase YcbB/YkuD